MFPRSWIRLGAVLMSCAPLSHGSLITFEDLTLAPNTYWTGTLGVEGGFESGGLHFRHHYYESYGYTAWNGFAYSNVADTKNGTYENQYAVISGAGQGGSGNYSVGYDDHYTGGTDSREMVITLANPSLVREIWVNNTTYAYVTMRDGDPYGWSKRFGGVQGTDPDWFRVTFYAFDAASQPVGAPVEFYLADFRSSDPTEDYIVNTWTPVDLSGWGSNVSRIELGLSSSDTNTVWGMNTPAYVAIDSISIVPEPGTLGIALMGWAMLRLRRNRS